MKNNNHKSGMGKTMHIATLAIIAVFLTSAMLLVGCSKSSLGTNTQKYYTGTSGLEIEFSDTNPTEVYEGEQFGNMLFVRNLGATNVTSGNPGIMRISYDNYRLKSDNDITESDIVLPGKSVYYPRGDEFPISFYFTAQSLTKLRESAATIVHYNLCYPYTTELSTMTCIDTKKAKNADAPASCESKPYSGSSGQGAPIVISQVEPEILIQSGYVRPQFKITITNAGQGYISNAESCTSSEIANGTFSGKMKVEAWLSGVRMECGPEGEGIARLIEDSVTIKCYLPQSEQGYDPVQRNYETPLTIKLTYNYITIEEQEIEIMRNQNIEPEVTQGYCESAYQVEYNGECISRCEFCANNPDNSACQANKPFSIFSFVDTFSCTCGLDKCETKLDDGNCIKGYCPGSLYCCSNNQCDEWQVEYNGKCIDKCEYCKVRPDSVLCAGIDFTGFRCESMNKTECINLSANGACLLGYCGGANADTMYCVNRNRASTLSSASSSTTLVAQCNSPNKLVNSQCITLCDYCANHASSNDPECEFNQNNGVKGRIVSGFSCSCEKSRALRLEVYNWAPETKFCNDDGMYCCKTA